MFSRVFSESGAFFQILMHNDFQQTNVIQLEFFTQALCWIIKNSQDNQT